jgi:hypothetical protein
MIALTSEENSIIINPTYVYDVLALVTFHEMGAIAR